MLKLTGYWNILKTTRYNHTIAERVYCFFFRTFFRKKYCKKSKGLKRFGYSIAKAKRLWGSCNPCPQIASRQTFYPAAP
jgi:hypothetical protein